MFLALLLMMNQVAVHISRICVNTKPIKTSPFSLCVEASFDMYTLQLQPNGVFTIEMYGPDSFQMSIQPRAVDSIVWACEGIDTGGTLGGVTFPEKPEIGQTFDDGAGGKFVYINNQWILLPAKKKKVVKSILPAQGWGQCDNHSHLHDLNMDTNAADVRGYDDPIPDGKCHDDLDDEVVRQERGTKITHKGNKEKK